MADFLGRNPALAPSVVGGAHHERANEPTAPLWPNRALGGARRRGCRAVAPLDYSEPCDMGAFYKNVFRPALEAVGLPASRPATTREDESGNRVEVPAVEGVRLHDLRHTFAALQLSAGTHFMQVSKWLGRATYTLTLDVYGDYIAEENGGSVNSLPEPTVPVAPPTNVVPLPPRSTFTQRLNPRSKSSSSGLLGRSSGA